MSTPSATHRRSETRTTVVWEALRAALGKRPNASVVDIGGGTGGFAVRVAELGHPVTVVDPSPDALAILARRAEERGVASLVTGVQGELATFSESLEPADVVLCHGVLEVVDEPATALATIAAALHPGGLLSLLVAQRHAAVIARAMAGHLEEAHRLLDDPGTSPRRYTAEEILALLESAGFQSPTLHAAQVFVDLVPSTLLDLEAGAAGALIDLERAVAERPEYLPLATRIHALATLGG
jgi:2-polyprenyl-3-methyl-5-hydroxy-6-metoxy-1,4-benzoquinol methylase